MNYYLKFILTLALLALNACSAPASLETNLADVVYNSAAAKAKFGTCMKCGDICSAQKECIANSFLNDHPLPYCVNNRCTTLEQPIRVRIEVETQNWGAVSVIPRSSTVRFIKKIGIDDVSVTCARVASSTAQNKSEPSVIEESGAYTIQGFDVIPIINPKFFSQGITLPSVKTQTGGDFLIWFDVWAGSRDAVTQLPTANRLGWGCYESSMVVGSPIIPEDDCKATSSNTCRTFSLKLPPPR